LAVLKGSEIASEIYAEAQRIISTGGPGTFPKYGEQDLFIRQIDVFKLNHWDNNAKRSSLKWIQFSMDWHNIQDMPIHHSSVIRSHAEIETIIGYCRNDVASTKRIMELSSDQIALRRTLTNEYKISLYNASEPRISKELFLMFLSKETGIHKWDLRQMRTRRQVIDVGSIILPYIKFRTVGFRELLAKFQSLQINPNNTKGGFRYSVNYKGIRTDFGLGGVHGAKPGGIYTAKDGMIIMTSDVASFYPNLAIRNGWAPAHLPKDTFCQLYEWFYEERKKIPKKDPKNYVYKIILNSTYGLSNDQNSFLYDPEFTMRITINGQLTLIMLYEMLSEGIPDAVPIMHNTDGLEMMIPEKHKDLYLRICAEWEKLTSLQLEHDQYQEVFLADVNNYIAVNIFKEVSQPVFEITKQTNPHYVFRESKDKWEYAPVKCKGRFEFRDLALHKNKSFLIIPKAIFYYFVHNVMPESYLASNRNIFDYCAGVRIKGDWTFYETNIESGEVKTKALQPTLRYYVTEKGSKIIWKHDTDGRERQVEAGQWMQKVFNQYHEASWQSYNVNDRYYLEKIHNEIENILPKVGGQLNLF
jgi:hypothetical protein